MTGATVRGARVSFEELGRDELILIASPHVPLASRKHVPLAELCDERWVFRESGSGTRQVAERILAEHGLDTAELRVAVELGTGEAIVSAVEGGLGIAVVSRFVADKAIKLGPWLRSTPSVCRPSARSTPSCPRARHACRRGVPPAPERRAGQVAALALLSA